ncbi:hypothetical protein [Acidithiobacillus sulfurivorans]|uniref:TIGR04222 domain-containing membrane protein n=1 Tax=Acidithiobacillus sulfurivorans TaxID=1958756 RepID=A0ABS6A2H8_9PROT|nr:hypothetical protein [Acidithiobacillus sulfurivorans]MBU2761714.1 hypothetical protein [Acidithiobacillus sulfurivorans]
MAELFNIIFYALGLVLGSGLIKVVISLDTTWPFRRKNSATQILEMQNLHDQVVNCKGSVAAKQMLFDQIFGFRPEEKELEYLVRKDDINLLSRMKYTRSVLEFDDTEPTYRLKKKFSRGLLFYYAVSDAFFWLIAGMLVGFLLVLAFSLHIHNTDFTYKALAFFVEMVAGLIMFAPIRRDWDVAMDIVEKYFKNIVNNHGMLGFIRNKLLPPLGILSIALGFVLSIIITSNVIEPHDDIAKIRPVTQAKIIQGLKPQKTLPVIRHDNQRALVAPTISQGQKMPVYPTKAPVSATLSAQ